jgi:hypothetical protein
VKKFLVLLVFVFAGCKETLDVVNGEIPAEYIPLAQPYMGTYNGKIDGLPAEITLALNGNKVVITGTAPISNHCEGVYGDLNSIVVEKKNEKINVTGANFTFDPNKCRHRAIGREVHLSFKNDKLYFSYLLDRRQQWNCPPRNFLAVQQTPPVPQPPQPPVCRPEYVDYYVQGVLRK